MKTKFIFSEKVKKYLVAFSAMAGVAAFLSLTSLLTGCTTKAVATPTHTPTPISQVQVTNVPQVVTPIPTDTPAPTFTPTPVVVVTSTNTPTPTPTRKPTATPTPSGFAGVDITPRTGWVFATDSINIRSGPGTSYRAIGGGRVNEEFALAGECSNGWWQIKYAGDVAYISQEYSALKGVAPTCTPKPGTTSTPVTGNAPSFEDYVGFTGKAYCVIDAQTGKVLYSLNADQKLQPASLTKMLTAVVVAEQIYFDDVSPTHKKALRWNTITYQGQEVPGLDDEMTTYAAKVGGKYTLEQWMETEYSVEDRLYMMLLHSAADAAEALCYQICDSVDFFVDLMAEKAEQIGLENSNFNNPVGADGTSGYDGIYSTASDLCKVARKLLEDPTLRKIVSTSMYTVPASGSIPATTLKNTNLLISDPNYMSEYFTCTGIKTGNTQDAGYCLAAAGKNAAGKEVIVVTLGGKTRASNAEETVKILEYVFRYNKDYQ